MPILSIDSLKEMGSFADAGPPVEREVIWNQGEQEFAATVFVRQMSYRTVVNEIKSDSVSGDNLAKRIASCICDQEGKPVFTPDDITGDADPSRGPLNANLTLALLEVIADVNSLSGKPKS